MKALITGINGFAGRYLAEELRRHQYEVYGIDIAGSNENVYIGDITDPKTIEKVFSEVKPDYLFHLAGQANVKLSWEQPVETMHGNVDAAVRLLQAGAKTNPSMRLIIIGSADQYGVVKPENCPIREDMPLRPSTPYAISKQAQEQMVLCLAKAMGMDVVFTRSFNHTGPGQKKGFVVADLAGRIARVKKYGGAITVGNLEAKRDFSDVRDSVRAYRLLAEKGKSGQIYNVGSGVAHSIDYILRQLMKLANVETDIIVDQANLRPSDMPISVADCTKIYRDTGYQPQVTLEQTLEDILHYYMEMEET